MRYWGYLIYCFREKRGFERSCNKLAEKIIKNWTESLLGVELEVPLRYMYIPEVELVSYSEEMNLSESEGRFEVLLKQSFKREQYVEVGDPLSLGKKGLGKLIGGISKIFGKDSNENGGSNEGLF